jgi:hypothetical protein
LLDALKGTPATRQAVPSSSPTVSDDETIERSGLADVVELPRRGEQKRAHEQPGR